VIIGVSGNIGAGKSSLSRILSEKLGFEVVYEAVDENPYLADFYKDMKRWAFHSQLFFLMKRFDFLKRVDSEGRVIIQDRTIYEDVNIFARNLWLLGHIDDRDWGLYQDSFETISEHLKMPAGFVYIRCSVETLMKRISTRGRDYESSASVEYIKKLNDLYDSWFDELEPGRKIIIDGDRLDFVLSERDRQTVTRQVSNFVSRLSAGVQAKLFDSC